MKQAGRIAALIFATIILVVYSIKFYRGDETGLTTLTGTIQFLILPWLWVLVIAISAYCLGKFIIGLLGKLKSKDGSEPPELTNIEAILYSLGAGFTMQAILVWFMGWIHILYDPVLVLFVLIPIGVFYRSVPDLYKRISELSSRFVSFRGFHKLLVIFIILWILRTLLIPCNPSIGGDPLNTHLWAPRLYLNNHGISHSPIFSYLQLHSMLAMLQMSFFRDPGSLLPYFFMVLSSSMIYLIGRQWFGRIAGLIGALLFMLIPMSHAAAMQNLVEHTLTFFLLLGMHGVLKYHDTKNTRWLTFSGIFLGSACSVDINGLVPSFLIMVMAFRQFWRPLLWGAIFAAPWYICNVISYGNPLYPFYDNVLGFLNFGLHEADSIYRRDPGYLAEIQAAEASSFTGITALWRYTFTPNVEWVTSPTGRIGPFILALTPTLLFVKWNRAAKLIGAFVLVAYIYWLAYEQIYNARMLIYLFALHGLLGAYGLATAIGKPNNKLRWPHYAFSILTVAFALTITLTWIDDEIHVTDDERFMFIFTHKPAIVHIEAINQTDPDGQILVPGTEEGTWTEFSPEQKEMYLGPDKTCYLLGLQYYPFYADFNVVGYPWGPSNWVDFYNESTSAAHLAQWLKDQGCSLLLVEVGMISVDEEGRDYSQVFYHDPQFDDYFQRIYTPHDVRFADMASRLYLIR